MPSRVAILHPNPDGCLQWLFRQPFAFVLGSRKLSCCSLRPQTDTSNPAAYRLRIPMNLQTMKSSGPKSLRFSPPWHGTLQLEMPRAQIRPKMGAPLGLSGLGIGRLSTGCSIRLRHPARDRNRSWQKPKLVARTPGHKIILGQYPKTRGFCKRCFPPPRSRGQSHRSRSMTVADAPRAVREEIPRVLGCAHRRAVNVG